MMDIHNYFGRNFNITKEAGKRYDALRRSPLFSGLDSKSIFMLAMSIAYVRKLKRKKIERYPLLNTSSFSREDLWSIVAIAFEETGNLEVLNDSNEVKRIAEEYAMAGLPEVERLLMDENVVLSLHKLGLDRLSLAMKAIRPVE